MRYFLFDEFFGLRVYDSYEKTEFYFDKNNSENIKNLLKGGSLLVEKNNNIEQKLSAPLKISMNITKKCNLRCKQCFSDSGEMKDNELTTKEIFNLFDDMHSYGTFFICIGGGEPLIRDDILDILQYGKSKQLSISIVSNGLLLTKELINELNKCDLDTIWISLEGLEKNHDFLRGRGTYQKAISALLLLKKYSNSKTAIRVSLSKYNINEYKEIIKLAEKYSVDILRFTPLMEFGRAKDQNFTISQKQYIQFLKEIQNIKSNVKIIHPNVIDCGKFWISSSDFGCHCGKETVWIDEVGNYFPCIFLGESYTIGNIKKDSYIDLWKKSLEITTVKGNDTCKQCNNYLNCRGGCRARALNLYKNINEIDPLCPLMKNLGVEG